MKAKREKTKENLELARELNRCMKENIEEAKEVQKDPKAMKEVERLNQKIASKKEQIVEVRQEIEEMFNALWINKLNLESLDVEVFEAFLTDCAQVRHVA